MLTTSESDVEQASSSTPPTTTITRGTRLTPNAQRNVSKFENIATVNENALAISVYDHLKETPVRNEQTCSPSSKLIECAKLGSESSRLGWPIG